MISRDREDALFVTVIAALWLFALALSGSLTDNYQLTDDHEILRIVADVRANGVIATAWHWAITDFGIRFRPLFFVHRTLQAATFGNHLLAWSVYTGLLGLLCSCLLFRSLRLLRFSSLEALTFAFFALVGEQSAVWWRRGVNETIGMVVLSFALLSLAWRARVRSPAARASFVASAVLLSLCKESFTLLIPALLFGLVWASRSRGASWSNAARDCALEAIGLLALMLAELAFIKYYVGTEKIGYAGLRGLTVGKYVDATWKLVGFGHLAWVSLAICALGLLSRGARALRRALPPLTLWALIVAPQAIMYGKVGVLERYYLPGVLGTAFFLAWSIRAWRQRDEAPQRGPLPAGCAPSLDGPPVNARWTLAILAVAGLALLPLAERQAKTMYLDAERFAAQGRAQQGLLDRITTASCQGPVLFAGGLGGVFESFWSIHFYLRHKAHRGDEYFYYVEHEPLNEFARGQVEGFAANAFYRKLDPARGPAQFACIGILAGAEPAFVEKTSAWFDPAAYSRNERDGYTVYTKR